MTDIKLALSDIDGTLLTNKQEITAKLHSTINSLDFPFVLASARPPFGLTFLQKELNIQDNPIVSFNGALVLSGNKIIAQHPLTKDLLFKIINTIQDLNLDMQINAYTKEDWFIDKQTDWTEIEAKVVRSKHQLANMEKIFNGPKEFFKLLVIGSAPDVEKLKVALSSEKELNCTKSQATYLEITDINASKVTALNELINYFSLKPEQTMALGDNFNDVPMISAAGIGVAMGNAPQKVKEIADYITDDNEHDGVANALQKFI